MLDLLGHILRQIGRDLPAQALHSLGRTLGTAFVFIPKGEDVGGIERLFAHRALALVQIAQHRAVDLPQVGNAGLHDHPIGIFHGGLHRLLQLLPVSGLADADAAAQIHRFDYHRVTAADGLHPLDLCLGIVEPLFLVGQDPLHHRQTGAFEQGFHGPFVHTHRRSTHIAPGIGNVQVLKEALQGAVFHIGAVGHGQDHIHLSHSAVSQLLGRIALKGGGVFSAHQHHPGGLLQSRRDVLIGVDLAHMRTGIEFVVLCDINGHRFVFLLIQSGNGLHGRDHRDLVLHAFAAKKDAHANLHTQSSPFPSQTNISLFVLKTIIIANSFHFS